MSTAAIRQIPAFWALPRMLSCTGPSIMRGNSLRTSMAIANAKPSALRAVAPLRPGQSGVDFHVEANRRRPEIHRGHDGGLRREQRFAGSLYHEILATPTRHQAFQHAQPPPGGVDDLRADEVVEVELVFGGHRKAGPIDRKSRAAQALGLGTIVDALQLEAVAPS